MPVHKVTHSFPILLKMGLYYKQLHKTPIMTLDEYKELLLQDELKIGYGIPEDEDYDELKEIEDDCYIDSLRTDGHFHECDASEMFGEEVIGYSLY